MASETAAVSLPALDVCKKTSKGSWPPFSLTVTKVVPSGVLMRKVSPSNMRGRGFFGSGKSDGCSPLLRWRVSWVSSTTFSREPVT